MERPGKDTQKTSGNGIESRNEEAHNDNNDLIKTLAIISNFLQYLFLKVNG